MKTSDVRWAGTVWMVAAVGTSLCSVAPALAQGPTFPQNVDKAYFIRNPQLPDTPANRAYWHSGLATNVPGQPVWDDVLTTWTLPLATSGGKMHYAFSQCFGGGMAEEVTKPAGRISASSASRWDEEANYGAKPRNPAPANGVNNSGVDWASAYISGVARVPNQPAPTAAQTTTRAWFNDPWGTYPANPGNPFPTFPRGPDEVVGDETAQYRDPIGSGQGFTHAPGGPGRRFAVLWSGQPIRVDPVDGTPRNDDTAQTIDLYNTLINDYGYNPQNVWVFHGNANDPTLAQMVPGNRFLPATAFLLQQALTVDIATIANFGMDDQFFFFANDHGAIWNEKMSADRSGYLEVPKGRHGQRWLPGYDGNPQFINPNTDWRRNRWWVPAPGSGVVMLSVLAIGLRRRR